MTWQAPTFVELKMDAEVGSYQDDFDRDEELSTVALCPRSLSPYIAALSLEGGCPPSRFAVIPGAAAWTVW